MLDFETDTVSFLKAPKAGALNSAMMNEDILAALDHDKSETLLIVEPLYRTLRHLFFIPFWVVLVPMHF